MKTIIIVAFSIPILFTFNTSAQESVTLKRNSWNSVVINGSFGIGTFAAGENVGGSAFLGNSLSADWMPDAKTGVTYGLESGLLIGETQEGSIIYGIPAIIRFGWHPGTIRKESIDFFILVKTGWGFGIWGPQSDNNSSPNGIVGGFNFCGRYYLTGVVDVYAELGYTYYGLARSSNHPEYPLGYGSGKVYASLGLSFKMGKQQ